MATLWGVVIWDIDMIRITIEVDDEFIKTWFRKDGTMRLNIINGIKSSVAFLLSDKGHTNRGLYNKGLSIEAEKVGEQEV